MKKIITAFVFCFLCGECFSQAGEWVWIKGDSVPNQPGNFGVQGVPSPTNNPPSLYEPCEWTDLNGNFWLFGGYHGNTGSYGDLWKYDILTNEWTWIKGSGIINNPGNYGVQGIPSLTNNPPPRSYGMASWVDTSGNLWMFGGAFAPINMAGYNDLWKFEIGTNQWTWMKGSNIGGQLGNYGTQGVPDTANNPGARWESAAAWTDDINNLWLFGGFKQQIGNFNDLWRYNIASNTWTWMTGSQLSDQLGIYGILGIEDSLNTPGARGVYSHWQDSSEKLWLFGGLHYYDDVNFNDLWAFNIITNNWTWVGGSNLGNVPGDYGTKCLASSTNIPTSRYENRASWTDQYGNFWLFGGHNSLNGFFNDLWMYCIATDKWIWESADSTYNPNGGWGTMGVSSPINKPNGRMGSISWKDQNSNLFLFGGWGMGGKYNDLWKYTIDTTCGVCPAPNSIQEYNFTNELLVFPNPTNSSLTISFSSSEKQKIELRIYNTLGKQIYFTNEEITKGKFEKEINVGKWSDGIYFLQVKTKDGNAGRKVIVNH